MIQLLLWLLGRRWRPDVLGDAEARPLEERVHVLHLLLEDLARSRAAQVRRQLQKPAREGLQGDNSGR